MSTGPISQQDAIRVIANYLWDVQDGFTGEEVGKKGTVKVSGKSPADAGVVKGADQTQTIREVIEYAQKNLMSATVDGVSNKTGGVPYYPPVMAAYAVGTYDPGAPSVGAEYAVMPMPDFNGGEYAALYAVMPDVPFTPAGDELGMLRGILQRGAAAVDAAFGSAIQNLKDALRGGHLTEKEVEHVQDVLDGYQAAEEMVTEMIGLYDTMQASGPAEAQ